jgi:hypothetical protein
MTKRVAFCMRGGVSTYRSNNILDNGQCKTPNDIYKNKKYINMKAVYHSIQKHIIQTNPTYTFDFFLQCWNTDLEDKLTELYHPKRVLFEDNNLYKDAILSKCQHPSDFAGPSQLLAMKKSLQLKESYEKTHEFKYDVVILYRYDVLLWKDIHLDLYDISKHIYSSWYYLPETVGDFHFIMTSKNASKFKHCYDWITDDNPYGDLPHDFIYRYITYGLNESIQLDSIYPTIDQDVIRKIHPQRIQQLYEYGITLRDIKHSKHNTHIYFMDFTVYLVILCSILLSLRYKTSATSWVYYQLLLFILLIVFCFLLHYIMTFLWVSLLLLVFTMVFYIYRPKMSCIL